MKEFIFLNYHTEYSCKGVFSKTMRAEACFSKAFSNTDSVNNVNEEYKIILYKGTDFIKDTHNSNACIFTRTQIKNHLKQAQGIFPFEFTIKELKNWNKRYEVFEITLNLKDVPGSFHRYLLTWVRYLYEYPYNVVLYDALQLKKENCFRFTSIVNLFNLVLGCYCNSPREIHQITPNQVSKPMDKESIRNKLKKISHLNSIYNCIKKKCENNTIEARYLEFSYEDIEYWNSKEIFENFRKPIYLKVYNKLIRKK